MSANQYRFRLDLQKMQPTADSSGGAKLWSNPLLVQGSIPCDIQSASSAVRMRYDQVGLFVTHQIFFGRDQGISVNMRLAKSDGSRYYLVHGYIAEGGSDAPGSWQTVYVADVEEQRPPG